MTVLGPEQVRHRIHERLVGARYELEQVETSEALRHAEAAQ